jgi:hypothetical protein
VHADDLDELGLALGRADGGVCHVIGSLFVVWPGLSAAFRG